MCAEVMARQAPGWYPTQRERRASGETRGRVDATLLGRLADDFSRRRPKIARFLPATSESNPMSFSDPSLPSRGRARAESGQASRSRAGEVPESRSHDAHAADQAEAPRIDKPRGSPYRR